MKTKKPRSKASTPAGESASPPAKPVVLTTTQTHALLFLIVAIATFLRVYRIDTVPPGFYADEAMDGNNAIQALETGQYQVFYPENHGREGLFINLTAPCIYFFGNTAWAVRLPSVVFGILTVWSVYLLTAAFFPPPVALLASFFTATSFWHLTASRFDNRTNAAPFFLALTLYLLVAVVKRLRKRKPYAAMMAFTGAVYGIGFHTYPAYRATPLLIGGVLLYWFFEARKEGRLGAFWKASLWFIMAAAVVMSPLVIYFFQHPATLTDRALMVSVFNEAHPFLEVAANVWKVAQMFFLTGDGNWRQNISGQRQLFWPVAILFATGVAIAIGAMHAGIRRRPAGPVPLESCFPYALALGWIAVGILPTIFTTDGVPHAHRSLIITPAVFLLTAVGAVRVYAYSSRAMPRTLRISAAAALLLVFCCEPYYRYFDVWAVDPNVPKNSDAALVAFAGRVNAVPPDVPKYIAIARNTNLVNGLPIEVQTAVFLTRSYTWKDREAANIHYVMPPPGVKVDARVFCGEVVQSNPGARVFCLQ